MRANKDGLLAVRVSPAEKEEFEALAEAQGMRVSDLLRQFVQREIRKSRREKSSEAETRNHRPVSRPALSKTKAASRTNERPLSEVSSQQTSKGRMTMITETKPAPGTLSELASALAEIAGHIDWITEGLEEFPFTRQTDVLVARMEQAGVDGPCAAFHGFTYAWILAKQPELINEGDAVLGQILWIEDENYRTHVVLRSRVLGDYNRVSLLLPRIFDQVDQTWAGRQPEDED
jgi:hypothetical protein